MFRWKLTAIKPKISVPFFSMSWKLYIWIVGAVYMYMSDMLLWSSLFIILSVTWVSNTRETNVLSYHMLSLKKEKKVITNVTSMIHERCGSNFIFFFKLNLHIDHKPILTCVFDIARRIYLQTTGNMGVLKRQSISISIQSADKKFIVLD